MMNELNEIDFGEQEFDKFARDRVGHGAANYLVILNETKRSERSVVLSIP